MCFNILQDVGIALGGMEVGELLVAKKVVNLVSRAFGRRLAAWRKTKFNTARAFALELGMEENTYTRWERGETEPAFETLLRMCHMLGATPDELLLGPAASRQTARPPKTKTH